LIESYYTRLVSPWGTLILAAQQDALAGVWFESQLTQPDCSGWVYSLDSPVLQLACTQLQEYFAGQRHSFNLPLNYAQGTSFQQSVWQVLAHIPYGNTCSYQQLAEQLGKPNAVRAVARAVASNPWILVVPCHRIIGKSGNLTGYAAGLERKSALLQFEKNLHP
jgi:methylated-DNA-[protein]-cysteine S-methyltransferase